jgi:hypothetical protein
MKAILFHPADDPLARRWTKEKWDAAFDLGWAGEESYCCWQRNLYCPVAPLGKLESEDFRQVREALSCATGFLTDDYGLDWWELIALDFHQQLQELMRLRKVALDLSPDDEVFITRDCFQAQALELFGNFQVHRLTAGSGFYKRAAHYASAARKLSISQLLEIAGDKYDTGFRLRRLIAAQPSNSSGAVVLLPSAYGNATRTELQYAAMLPGADFLLVTTRKSGRPAGPPNNIKVEALASYAGSRTSGTETESLLKKWFQLERRLESHPLFSVLIRCGSLAHVPRLLRDGLMVRDAWFNVFKRRNISAVLCADDANRFTQLPLLMAVKRALPAMACHHGALDGRHRIRPSCHYPFLVKGQMEWDYAVRVCGVEAERVEIGAPGKSMRSLQRPQQKPSIVFFSEPYEISGGRCREFYSEILPRLQQVATDVHCELIVKLHPFESRREREKLIHAAMSGHQRPGVRILTGPLTEDLLKDALCAVTISSTTAVECTLLSIPVFLCGWLDYSDYGYLQQFAKFGAGKELSSAEELSHIPAMLEDFPETRAEAFWQPVAPERLGSLLGGCPVMAMAG